MFSRLLQKGLFKERWSLAKRHLKQNYCHACHTRFAVFFPLPSCCVSSLLTEGQRHTLDLKGCQCNSTKTYITCINKKNFRMMENKFIIITKRYYIYCKKSFNRNKINVCARLIKLPSLSQKDIYHGGPIHTEMRLLLFFPITMAAKQIRSAILRKSRKRFGTKGIWRPLLLHSKESFWVTSMKYLIVLTQGRIKG